MKRMNYKRKLISYSLIWSVLFSSFLIYSPANIALSATGDSVIMDTLPEDGSSSEDAKVELTGKVNDDVTAQEELTIDEPEQVSDIDNVANDIESEETLSNIVENGNIAEDSTNTNVTITNSNLENITLPTEETKLRPFVKSISVVAYENVPTSSNLLDMREPEEGTAKDKLKEGFNKLPSETDKETTSETDYQPAEDMTQVRLNSKILVTFSEPVLFDKNTTPVYVYPENGEEPIGLSYDSKENYQEIILTPNELLEPKTTYYVYINPKVKNAQGLEIITKSIEFTTRPLKHSVDIHGHYANNTNSCANCHSTHKGENEKLVGGTIESSDPTETLCMACHDGTVATRMSSYEKDNEHYQIHQLSKAEGSTCASCHNPHAGWTGDDMSTTLVNEANPNKIKNHAVNTYVKSTGLAPQFNLCLRCHDGSNSNVSNIQEYYENAEILASSGHNFAAVEGYSVSGQMPCSDCHETHGSNNDYSLKENLGNTKINLNGKFVQEPKPAGNNNTGLTINDERNFCLKCHSSLIENAVDLYGKKATFNETSESHLDKTKACSDCHGSGDNKKQSAAHAPKRLTSVAAE